MEDDKKTLDLRAQKASPECPLTGRRMAMAMGYMFVARDKIRYSQREVPRPRPLASPTFPGLIMMRCCFFFLSHTAQALAVSFSPCLFSQQQRKFSMLYAKLLTKFASRQTQWQSGLGSLIFKAAAVARPRLPLTT